MAFFRCGSGSGGGGGETVIVTPEITGTFANTGLVIQNGKYISGFGTTTSNRDYFPKTPTAGSPVYDFSKPFHFRIKVKFTGTYSGGLSLCDPLKVYMRQDNTGNRAVLEWKDVNNATNYLRITVQELSFSLNAWYTLDIEGTSTSQKFTVTDGNTTVVKTGAFAQHAAMSNLRFGNVEGTNMHSVFDFSDMYWEQDGVIIWGNKESEVFERSIENNPDMLRVTENGDIRISE